jgi:cysteine-rich repeat protein
MRTGTLLWTAMTALAVSSFVVTGCGDDSPVTGGGSEGGGGSENLGGGGSDPTGGAGASGGSGGEGGSGGAPANDTCDSPGDIAIAQFEEIVIQGTVAGAADDYQTFCADNMAGESAVDVVYQLTVADACNATFSVDGGGGFDAVISVRGACETESKDDVCFNAATTTAESGSVSLEAGTYFVMVSDDGGGDGTFSLSISCAPPGCGDYILDPGEECDFGNADSVPPGIDGDGCSDTCALEPNDPDDFDCVDVTAGAGTTVGLGVPVFVTGSTINGESNHTGSCQLVPVPPDEALSKENIIKVTPTAVGTMTITLGDDMNGVPLCGADTSMEPPFPFPDGCWDRTLYVRTTCALGATEIDCSESGSYYASETLTVPVPVANIPYYVFVDGWLDYIPAGDQSDVGTYGLTIELTP